MIDDVLKRNGDVIMENAHSETSHLPFWADDQNSLLKLHRFMEDYADIIMLTG